MESEFGITPIDCCLSQTEREKLYVEMLYTIANTVSVSFACSFPLLGISTLRVVDSTHKSTN